MTTRATDRSVGREANAGGNALEAHLRLERGAFVLDVELSVSPGDVLCVVGPSGAGKSTALAAIAGLLPLDEGYVRFGSATWSDRARGIDQPPHLRQIGFLHQDYALFPHLSVRQNVAFGAISRGARDAKGEANRWLAALHVTHLADRKMHGLSGGERQRVALARALASGAKVLLLDEPFASLDPATRASVRRELREFLASSGIPAIFVTHDQTDALVLGERIAVMEQGRITQVGSREELLTRPSTDFVAELFGLNFYRVSLSPGLGLREATVEGIVFHVLSHEEHEAASLAFPPSAVTLSKDRPIGSAQNVFHGTIREVHPLADRSRVVVDCGIRVAADVALEAAASLHLAPGHDLWVSVKATAIHVYPYFS